MSGGFVEVAGWSPTRAAERGALHVEICLAEGGFARVLSLGDGRVCWVGPDDRPWAHRPDGYRIVVGEEAELARVARAKARADQKAARIVATAKARQQRAANKRRAKAAKKRADEAAKLKAREDRRAAKAQAAFDAKAAVKALKAPRRRRARSRPARSGRARPLSARDCKRALRIMAEVAQRAGISVDDLVGARRLRAIAWPRQGAMWLIYQLRDDQGRRVFSLPRIGMLFRRDHGTVHQGIRRYAARAAYAAASSVQATQDQAWRSAA